MADLYTSQTKVPFYILTSNPNHKRENGKLEKYSKEKGLVKLIQENSGAMFQADIMEKLNIGKVGMTRMLDKLEAKQIIERKRRGMNNIVVLKN